MVIFINQIRMKIGVMFGSPETTTGGNALKFYASVRLDIRRIGSIKKGEEVIGNETKVKVVKNKVSPPFKTAEFDILYGEGISREGEIIDMGVEAKVLEKSGSWYAYNGEKIGQGKDNAREFLRENVDLAVEIENKVREAMGIPLLPGARGRGAGQAEGRQGLIVRAGGSHGSPARPAVAEGPRAAAAGAARPEPARAAGQAAAPCRGRSPRRAPRPRPTRWRERHGEAGDEGDRRAEVEALLDWLEANRYLSAERFAESRVHAREPPASATGASGRELAQHGVALVARGLSGAGASRSCNAPPRCASAASRQPPRDAAERAAQARFLAGRGFSPEVIQRVLRR